MKPPHSALPGDNRATWATAFEAAQLIKPPACGWCLTAVGAKLVQDALLGRRVRLLVPRVNSLQILPFRSLTHEVTRLHGG